EIGVDDLDSGRELEVAGGDLTRPLGGQVQGLGLAVLEADDDLLDVEDQVDDVLHHTLDGGELVFHAFDLDAGDGGAGNARQQGAAHGVAERVPETGLQRLDDEARPVFGDLLFFDMGSLDD